MPEKKLGGKLKLRKADTSRLKVDTGRLKTGGGVKGDTGRLRTEPIAPEDAPTVQQAAAEQTGEIRVPVRHETSGKVLRVQSPDDTSATATTPPAPPAPEGARRETVRLKVVRSGSKSAPSVLPKEPLVTPPGGVPTGGDDDSSARTVKISLAPKPGVPKKVVPGVDLKKATSTVRVQSPAEEEAPPVVPQAPAPPAAPAPAAVAPPTPGGTVKVPAPDEEDYTHTGTATVKLQLRKPNIVSAKPSVAEAKEEEEPSPVPAPSKKVTATLKIRPSTTTTGAAEAAPVVPVAPAAPQKDSASSGTIKIKPVSTKPGAGAQAGKSLRLKKSDSPSSPAERTVKLPGLDDTTDKGAEDAVVPPAPVTPPEEGEDASKTVAIDPVAEAPRKKGLKLKPAGKKDEEKTAGEVAPEAAPEEAPDVAAAAAAAAAKAAASATGEESSVIAFVSTLLACGGIAAALVFYVRDFMNLVLK